MHRVSICLGNRIMENKLKRSDKEFKDVSVIQPILYTAEC